MPGLHRPNAPDYLPEADLENLFSRSQSPTARAPGHVREASQSPQSPVSPKTVVSQRGGTLADRRKLKSESSVKSPLNIETIARTSALENVSSGILEGNTAIKVRASSDSLSSGHNSQRSSISSRTRKIFNLPNIHISDERPAAPAKTGFKRKRDLSGYWLEVQIGRKRPSDEQSQTATEPKSSRSQVGTSEPLLRDRRDSAPPSAAGIQSYLPAFDNPKSPESIPLPPKEGLYCRTKRYLGLKSDLSDPFYDELEEKSRTGHVLDRASSALNLVERTRTPALLNPSIKSSATSMSNLSIAGHRWGRFGAGHRPSTSSSIRSLLMGKPPLNTPDSELMYHGSDTQDYFSVEMTQPDAPSLIPSEARRINTPPLPTGSRKGRRGFFFDYNAPSEEVETPDSSRSDNPGRGANGKERQEEKEWYRVKLAEIEAEAQSREEFASTVPDHLPNSPLCPQHPKHKSGGFGTCPLHGRRKSLSSEQSTTPQTSFSGTVLWESSRS